MAFGDKRYTMFDRTPDSALVMHTGATAVTASTTTNGATINVGDGAVDLDVLIDVTAYTAGTTGTFKFVLVGSDDSAFTNKYVLGFVQLGKAADIGTTTGVTPPNDAGIGRYLLKATNLAPNATNVVPVSGKNAAGVTIAAAAVEGSVALPCPYVRLQVLSANVSGASMTFKATANVEMR